MGVWLGRAPGAVWTRLNLAIANINIIHLASFAGIVAKYVRIVDIVAFQCCADLIADR